MTNENTNKIDVNMSGTDEVIMDSDKDTAQQMKETYENAKVNDDSLQCYIFLGDTKTSAELTNLTYFVDELCDYSSIMYVTDGEPIKDKNYCTQKSLEEFQEFLDEEEMTFYGNSSQKSMNSTIFCIIEVDREKRIKYLEDIKKYAGDLSYKVIFLTYLDSLFLEKLKEHDIKLNSALYAPYVSNAEFEMLGIMDNWEISTIHNVNKERLEDIYGGIMDLFEAGITRKYVSFAAGIHATLLKGSFEYLTLCFQQHIIKYGTLVNLNSTQINELIEEFGFDTFIDMEDNTVILPDAYENSKILTEIALPKHSIVSAAVVSESNRIDDLVQNAAKVIIANKISKIGIFGIPEGQNIYARFVNGLSQILNQRIQETSVTQEPFNYTMYLIDHCNETINTPEDSIQTNFGFELAIICDNKFFTTNNEDTGMEVVSYLEDSKKKYVTLDVNTGIVSSPFKKVQNELEGDTLNAN